MKNKAAFLAMEQLILEVVAEMRRGIYDLQDANETDALEMAKYWIGFMVSKEVPDRDIQDYVFYLHAQHDDTVLVVGIQQEAKGEEDPDKLFYCEVVRISVASLESWMAKGKPEPRFFDEAELLGLWQQSMEYTGSLQRFTELVNQKIKARWL